MSASRRIAVYGGTFDPVHNGHVEVARRIRQLFALEEVVFMPAYVAPHKRKTTVSSAFHRYAMLSLATQDEKELRISSAELDAPETPYSVETISRVRRELGAATRLFFLMGADSWSEITTWHDWERLLGLCDHVVVTRPGYEFKMPGAAAARNVVDVRGRTGSQIGSRLRRESGPSIFVTDAVMLDVSATEIRSAARAGRWSQLGKLVPRCVADYIEKYQLYRDSHGSKSEGKNAAV